MMVFIIYKWTFSITFSIAMFNIIQWYSNDIRMQLSSKILRRWWCERSSSRAGMSSFLTSQWASGISASNGAFKGSCVLDQLEPGLRARPNWLSHWLSQTLRGRTRTWQRFLNWGYPNGWMVYFMENLFFSGMVLGVPHFRKPPYQLHYDFVCSDIHL